MFPLQYNALVNAQVEKDKKLHFAAAMVCCTFAEVHRDSTKRSAPFKPADFLPSYEGAEPEEVIIGDLMSAVAMMNTALGGVDKRKK
jgi:hypothetical protein